MQTAAAQTTDDRKQQINDTRKFLGYLARGGSWCYTWFVKDKIKRTEWYPAGANPIIGKGGNIYFGVHPTDRKGDKYQRAKKGERDIAATNCLYAEFDCKDFGNDMPATLAYVQSLEPPPTIIVESGGGYHAYWIYTEPCKLTNEGERAQAAAIQAGWVARVGGDVAAKDLERVLRVPGTENFKYDPPRPVRFIKQDYSLLYDPVELSSLVVVAPSTRQPQTTGSLNADTSQNPEWVWAAVESELDIMRNTRIRRNDQLNISAGKLGSLIGNAGLQRSEVEQRLLAAANDCGFDASFTERDAIATIRSGINHGLKNPRVPPLKNKTNGAKPTASAPNVIAGEFMHKDMLPDMPVVEVAYQPKFRLRHADELDALPPIKYLISNEITSHGIHILHGAPGTGKSFVALDYALQLTTKGLPVVYMAAEGIRGIAQRKRAWCKHNKIDEVGPLYFVDLPVDLLNTDDVSQFIKEAIQGIYPVLLIVDTLAYSMASGDENRDGQKAINACRDIQRAQPHRDLAILLIHHNNKAGTAYRGDSKIHGGADLMLEIANDDGLITLSCGKSKDAPPFEPRYMRMLPVQTAGDETSCVLVPSDKVIRTNNDKLTGNERKIIEFLYLDTFRTVGATSSKLCEALNLRGGSLYNPLSRLMQRGLVVQDAKGDPFKLTVLGKERAETLGAGL